MIGKLTGILAEKTAETAVVDVQGVGYEIHLPRAAAEALGAPGDTVTFFIHTHVREDDLRLFGFATREEKSLFLLLMSVSGIGAKSSLQILSSGPIEAVSAAIRAKDVAALTKIPGIGKKTAERLALELSDKIQAVAPARAHAMPYAVHDAKSQVISALLNLGYKRFESEQAVARAGDGAFDQVLKESLKALGR